MAGKAPQAVIWELSPGARLQRALARPPPCASTPGPLRSNCTERARRTPPVTLWSGHGYGGG